MFAISLIGGGSILAVSFVGQAWEPPDPPTVVAQCPYCKTFAYPPDTTTHETCSRCGREYPVPTLFNPLRHSDGRLWGEEE